LYGFDSLPLTNSSVVAQPIIANDAVNTSPSSSLETKVAFLNPVIESLSNGSTKPFLSLTTNFASENQELGSTINYSSSLLQGGK
jgi:hypothetical protein